MYGSSYIQCGPLKVIACLNFSEVEFKVVMSTIYNINGGVVSGVHLCSSKMIKIPRISMEKVPQKLNVCQHAYYIKLITTHQTLISFGFSS